MFSIVDITCGCNYILLKLLGSNLGFTFDATRLFSSRQINYFAIFTKSHTRVIQPPYLNPLNRPSLFLFFFFLNGLKLSLTLPAAPAPKLCRPPNNPGKT